MLLIWLMYEMFTEGWDEILEMSSACASLSYYYKAKNSPASFSEGLPFVSLIKYNVLPYFINMETVKHCAEPWEPVQHFRVHFT